MDTGRVNGRRVLVVDDDAGFRATAGRLLESEGWSVVGEAHDGASALAAAASLRPDVVLLDIGLPDIDGFIVAERMASDGTPDIVLVSSRDRGTYAWRIASSVAVGFIAKGDLDGDGLRALLVAGSD
jgi:CheY-like chemotaxis protein